MIIAHAKKTRIKEIIAGQAKVSFFAPAEEKLKNKKIWLIHGANLKGRVFIDAGAKDALVKGASLLFQGIKHMDGSFKEDDVVAIFAPVPHPEDNFPNSPTEPKGKGEPFSEDNYEMIARGRILFCIDELQRFGSITKELRTDYFKANNIREIISHENMAFTDQ